MVSKGRNFKDLDSIIHKFETKWGKRLGELAILLYLSRKEEGAHAYELRTKVEEIIFVNRKEREKVLTQLMRLVEELLNLQELSDQEEYKRALLDLKQQLESYPFLFQNRYIQALFVPDSKISPQESFTYFSEILDLMRSALSELKSSSLLWSSISGIYPTINSLEKDGLITLHRTEQHEGRLRKIYTITDIGRKALQRAISSLLEITAFMFQIEREQGFYSDYSLRGANFSVMRKLFLKFREGLETKFNLTKNIEEPFLKTPLLNLLLPPELKAAFPFTLPFINAARIKNLLMGIEDDVQKQIIASNLKKRFEEMQKKIEECLEVLKHY